MTTPTADADQSWASLAEADEAERSSTMQARYSELSTLPEEERRAQLLRMTQAEYSLPDDKLRTMTATRLRVYLLMAPADVATLVASLEAVMNQLPATIAMRRVALVQTLSREFSVEDHDRLTALIPGVFGERAIPATAAAPPAEPATSSGTTGTTGTKRPWWAFWKSR